MITVKDRKRFRVLRTLREGIREFGFLALPLRPLLPRLFTFLLRSFQLGLKGWRVVGVGNCFEHLTESVGKFWPTLSICLSPYLRERPDECRSYKSCTCVNTYRRRLSSRDPGRQRSFLAARTVCEKSRDTPPETILAPLARRCGAAPYFTVKRRTSAYRRVREFLEFASKMTRSSFEERRNSR